MSRILVALALSAALCTCAAALLAEAAAPAVAATTKTCNISGSERSMGPSYVTSLKVKGVTCAAGKSLVKAYYQCRKSHGGVSGRCVSKVLGYSCSESRTGIDVQFNGTVTCKNGTRRVWHTYTQNT